MSPFTYIRIETAGTRVAGLYAWNRLGRRVQKGQKGIRILAPIIGVRRKKEEEAEKDPTAPLDRDRSG